MYTIITPERIELPPGTVVKLLGDWEDYQTLSQIDSQLNHIGSQPIARNCVINISFQSLRSSNNRNSYL